MIRKEQWIKLTLCEIEQIVRPDSNSRVSIAVYFQENDILIPDVEGRETDLKDCR